MGCGDRMLVSAVRVRVVAAGRTAAGSPEGATRLDGRCAALAGVVFDGR